MSVAQHYYCTSRTQRPSRDEYDELSDSLGNWFKSATGSTKYAGPLGPEAKDDAGGSAAGDVSKSQGASHICNLGRFLIASPPEQHRLQ